MAIIIQVIKAIHQNHLNPVVHFGFINLIWADLIRPLLIEAVLLLILVVIHLIEVFADLLHLSIQDYLNFLKLISVLQL